MDCSVFGLPLVPSSILGVRIFFLFLECVLLLLVYTMLSVTVYYNIQAGASSLINTLVTQPLLVVL